VRLTAQDDLVGVDQADLNPFELDPSAVDPADGDLEGCSEKRLDRTGHFRADPDLLALDPPDARSVDRSEAHPVGP
jgi:hypothetical protein